MPLSILRAARNRFRARFTIRERRFPFFVAAIGKTLRELLLPEAKGMGSFEWARSVGEPKADGVLLPEPKAPDIELD
ncbi:MAG TPA: hypothetical protein VJS64_05535 [Pyrinomonadaceae bacterium]|nr:hypothetical protein [Pyrinomonadaceae bacterium]